MVKSIGTFENIGRKIDGAISRVKEFAKSENGQKMIIAAKITGLVAAAVFTGIVGVAATLFATVSVAIAASSFPPLLLFIPAAVFMGGLFLTSRPISSMLEKIEQLQLDYTRADASFSSN